VAPETTAPTTAIGGATTTLPGGGATTTTAPTGATTTTVPQQVGVDQLQNLPPVWVSMLGPVLPGSQGGQPVDARRERLAKAFGLPVERTAVFTNRDTVAVTADGKPAKLTDGSASLRYVYATAPDQAGAAAICAQGAGLTCEVLQLTGAGRANATKPVLLLEPLASGTSLADLDAKLNSLRKTFGRPTVFAVSSKGYAELPAGRPVPFVAGFNTNDEITAACTQQQISPCTPYTLGPPG
jgi:hypothetical protein